MRRYLLKGNQAPAIGIFDSVVQGALWPPARKAAAGYPVDPRCQYCHTGEGTVRHQAWECPVLLGRLGTDREEARHLEREALREGREDERESWHQGIPPPYFRAFWERGLVLPVHKLGILQTVEVKTTTYGFQPGTRFRIPAGSGLVGGSDGSGGMYPTDPRRRRVGWSWAIIDPKGVAVASAMGGLEDKWQTVSRSELAAAIHFLSHTTGSCDLWIDNKYVVDTIDQFRRGWRPTTKTKHGELWDRLNPLMERLGEVTTRKIKSHLTESQALAAGYPWTGWKANQAADELAGEAAKEHQHNQADAKVVDRLDQTTRLVLRRLTAVTKLIVEEGEKAEKAPRPPPIPMRKRLVTFGKMHGHQILVGLWANCQLCKRKSRIKAAFQWAALPCPKREHSAIADSHHIEVINGLTFCSICGFWKSEGHSSKGLRRECTGQAGMHRGSILRRLRNHPARPPYGMVTWPDGTLIHGKRKRKLGNPENRSPNPTTTAWSVSALSHEVSKRPSGLVVSDKLDRLRDRIASREIRS